MLVFSGVTSMLAITSANRYIKASAYYWHSTTYLLNISSGAWVYRAKPFLTAWLATVCTALHLVLFAVLKNYGVWIWI